MVDLTILLESVASDDHEDYSTSEHYADLVRRSLGGAIACDPASSDEDNEVIRAKSYHTHGRSGLAATRWPSPFYLNPPSSRRDEFIDRAMREVKSGAECVVCLNLKHLCTRYVQDMLQRVSAIHIPRGRPTPRGRKGSPSDGMAFLYCGPNPSRFVEAFQHDLGLTTLCVQPPPERAGPAPQAVVR